MSSRRVPIVSVLLLLSAACAGVRGGNRASSPAGMHQADERIPASAAFSGKARTAYDAALAHENRGWQLESAGDLAGAREPLEAAARGYLAFVERHPGAWDVTLRYHAADLLRRAQVHDEAVGIAEKLAVDPRANAKSKAMAWLEAANARVGGKQLEPLKIVPAAERGDRTPEPRDMPEPWQRFSEAAEAFLASPEAAQPAPRDRVLSNAQLALIAGRVAFAFDDMETARRRLALVVERFADEPRAFESAAPLYVQTFLAARDAEGAQMAMEKVRGLARTQLDGAAEQDARAAYQKVLTDTERVATTVRYDRAKALLDAGKAPEAAREFEALAEEPGGDQAAALVSAAIASDQAGDPDRAAELRRRVVEQHADARVAPGAALQLAAYLSKKGDHAGAARTYATHVERWPDDPNHCTALRNGAIELDVAKQVPAAADAYRAFGQEARCAEASPDVAASALYRAGQLYKSARRRGEARDAFLAASEVKGVTTPDAKRHVADARREARQLGTAAGRRPSR